jgi:hypothetical protein
MVPSKKTEAPCRDPVWCNRFGAPKSAWDVVCHNGIQDWSRSKGWGAAAQEILRRGKESAVLGGASLGMVLFPACGAEGAVI